MRNDTVESFLQSLAARDCAPGGKSTRPGAEPLAVEEELNRMAPVVQGATAVTDAHPSSDSSRLELMREAVRVGASMINNVRALRSPSALATASEQT
jgi:dihydropteroate synthase